MNESVPPRLRLEQAILGSTLLSKTCLLVTRRIIGTDSAPFTEPAHRLIYDSVHRLFDQDVPIDAISVAEEMTARKELDMVGGPPYLHQLTEAAQTKFIERNARRLVFSPASVDSERARWLSENLPDYHTRLEGPRNTPSAIPTGFKDLDALLTGLEPGTFTVISGRPSVGKSFLLGNLACTAAFTHWISTVWIDQESPQHQILDRIYSAQARVPLHTLRSDLMTKDDRARLSLSLGYTANAPLLLQAGTRVDTDQVQQLVKDSGAQMVAVDGLQHLKPADARETREREVSDITRALKDIALEYGVAVVATAHLNRAPLQRFDPSPTLDDLRESDLIAHLADTVVLIERPDLRDPQSPRAGEADLIVVKHRNGPTCTITVAFQGHYGRFVDMSPA